MLQPEKLIDKGSYGRVYKSKLNPTTPVAIKKMCLNNHFNIFEKECYFSLLTKGLQHSIKVYKSFVYKNYGYIVMEYCKNDLLGQCNNKLFTEKEVAIIFHKICVAVNELHENNICHLDLKLDNILVTPTGDVKLIDFGSAVTFDTSRKVTIKEQVGTAMYVAPELSNEKTFDPVKADIWSLGVILHLLLVNCFPIKSDCVYISPENFTLSSLNISDSCFDLLQGMLKFTPSERLSLKEIITHPWFML